jgi:hypothetical protein
MALAGKELGKYVGYCIGLDQAPDTIKYVLLSLLFMVNCYVFFLSCLLHHHADYHWDRLFLRHHIPFTYDLFDHSYLLTYLTPSMTHIRLPT